MPEYLNKETMEKAVMAAKWRDGYDGAMAMEIVETAPTEDVEPVIHAHWILDDEYLTCSNCGESYLAGDTRSEVKDLLARGDVHKRCHECGAKMEEAKHESE